MNFICHLQRAFEETAPNVRGRLAHKTKKDAENEKRVALQSLFVFRFDAVKTKKGLLYLCVVFLSNISKTSHSSLYWFFVFLTLNGKRKEEHCVSFSFLH